MRKAQIHVAIENLPRWEQLVSEQEQQRLGRPLSETGPLRPDGKTAWDIFQEETGLTNRSALNRAVQAKKHLPELLPLVLSGEIGENELRRQLEAAVQAKRQLERLQQHPVEAANQVQGSLVALIDQVKENGLKPDTAQALLKTVNSMMKIMEPFRTDLEFRSRKASL